MNLDLQDRILKERLRQIQETGVPFVVANGNVTLDSGNYICHLGNLVETAVPLEDKSKDLMHMFNESWITSGRDLSPYYDRDYHIMAKIAGHTPDDWCTIDHRGNFKDSDFEIHQIYDGHYDKTYLFVLPHRDFHTGKRQEEIKRQEERERQKREQLRLRA